MRSVLPFVLTLAATLPAPAAEDPLPALEREVVARYAATAHEVYAEVERRAAELDRRIADLLARPGPDTLRAARESWTFARETYGESEVYRFYGGPIDDPRTGVELWINAWPIDESYLDAVIGREDAGIINDPQRHPVLDRSLLGLLNQRGGETNVATGWHAIEFLLWGQDLSTDGPGARSFEDYVLGRGTNAARRRDYLSEASALLLEHLRQVARAWAPGAGRFHATFVADDPGRSIGKMLTGAVVLCGFELSGERLAVAYETRDQEEEHSCFSDTTHLDLRANVRGVETVLRGGRDGTGPGLLDLARLVDPESADDLEAQMARTRAAVEAIPAPFDQAILGADDAPGRRAVLRAIEALEEQAVGLAAFGRALGIAVPMRPAE